MTAPDPRIIEDLAEAGARALLRSAREDEAQRQAIDLAVRWLLHEASELRHARLEAGDV